MTVDELTVDIYEFCNECIVNSCCTQACIEFIKDAKRTTGIDLLNSPYTIPYQMTRERANEICRKMNRSRLYIKEHFQWSK